MLENDSNNLLWDCTVRRDHENGANRSEIMIIDKNERCQIINVVLSNGVREGVREREDEKTVKYQDLREEVGKMWSVRDKVVPVAVGALGSKQQRLYDNLRTIEVIYIYIICMI